MSKQYKYYNIKRDDIKAGLECWYKGLKTVVIAIKDKETSLEAYDNRGVFIGYISKPYYTLVDHYKTREEIKTVTKCDSCPCLNRDQDEGNMCNLSNLEAKYDKIGEAWVRWTDNCPLEYIKYKDGAEFRPLEIEQ